MQSLSTAVCPQRGPPTGVFQPHIHFDMSVVPNTGAALFALRGDLMRVVSGRAPVNRTRKAWRMTTMTLDGIVQDATQELRAWREEHPDEDQPHDALSEIADSSVPLMTGDLLRLAVENLHLATDDPELGPASGCNFDGTPSPVNIIAANVFEHIERALWDAWQAMQDEDDEEGDDDAA